MSLAVSYRVWCALGHHLLLVLQKVLSNSALKRVIIYCLQSFCICVESQVKIRVVLFDSLALIDRFRKLLIKL